MTDSQLSLEFDSSQLSAVPAVPATQPKARTKSRTSAKLKADIELSVADMAAKVAADPNYRVLRRLQPVHEFARVAQGPVTRVVVLDTETTGLSHATDKIIELALLRVDVDNATGLPVGKVTVYDGLEDPGMVVSAQIQAITGISSEMVRGKTLDVALIHTLLTDVDLVIAHNAGFDRPFCEARLPAFAELSWGCSFADIDWKAEGQGSSKLENLALSKGWFYDAHRAEVDCHALLAVLAEPLSRSGQTGLAKLMASIGTPSFRLQATNAPFEAKDELKSRAYRWNAEHRVWHISLNDEAQLEDELVWLKSAVYANRPARVQVEKLDSRVNYSSRAGEFFMRQL